MTKPIGCLRAALWIAVVFTAACAEDDGLMDTSAARDADAGGDASSDDCPVMADDKRCDSNKRPIVFIHGSRGAGDGFGHPAQLFASNGYCSQFIRAVDYDGMSRDEEANPYPAIEAQIDALIADLFERTGKDRIDLVAHAQGAVYGTRYAAAHPGKIAHYVHVAGGQLSANPGGVPTLCLSSVGDRPVRCSTTKNVTIDDPTVDHFAVCAGSRSFTEIFTFLNGAAPEYTSVQCGDPIVIEGRAITFGDNQQLTGAAVEVHALSDSPRERGAPLTTLRVRDDGTVGPWTVRRGVAYEFKLVPPDGDDRKPRHVYFPPWKRSDRLLRFTFESRHPAAVAQRGLAKLDDRTAALWIRRKQGAFLHGRDQLRVDGHAGLSEQTAMAKATVTGLYVLDQNHDGQSNGGLVLRDTFVSGTDVYLQTSQPAFIQVEWNGRAMQVPNWPSQTAGLSVVFVE